ETSEPEREARSSVDDVDRSVDQRQGPAAPTLRVLEIYISGQDAVQPSGLSGIRIQRLGGRKGREDIGYSQLDQPLVEDAGMVIVVLWQTELRNIHARDPGARFAPLRKRSEPPDRQNRRVEDDRPGSEQPQQRRSPSDAVVRNHP